MMKIKCALILAVFGLLITTAYGDEPKNYRIQLSKTNVGTAELAEGEYTMLIHRDGKETKIRLTEVNTRHAIDVVAKVEDAHKTFERTEVHSQEVNGASQISEIRIGGTNFRVSFQQGS
jgi:hypothetical protein